MKQLMNEGHVPIPTRWVDTDRNSGQRCDGGPIVMADYKSSLCGRGDLEGIGGLHKDSPTAEIESRNLLFSWAASNKLMLETADISNAYFQSDQLDRLLLLRQPKGGIPDIDYADGETMILARVPIIIWNSGSRTQVLATVQKDYQRQPIQRMQDRESAICD